MCYDDAIIIDLVRISLEEKDVDLVGVLDSRNLISKVNQYQPAAIIFDLNMALKLGSDIINTIKTKNIPTVIFSSDLNGRQNSLEVGFDHFVQKSPYGFEELENLIDRVLEKEILAA